MRRAILRYGLIAGAMLSVMMLITIPFMDRIGFQYSMLIGYTTMVLAFLMIYFGIRSFRDTVSGGSVTFGRAFATGLGITLVASLCYVATWQLVYHRIAPDFMDKYTEYTLGEAREAGASEEQIAERAREMAEFKEMYNNPVVNIGVTLLEPMPVGLLFTLVSAAMLSRRRRVARLTRSLLLFAALAAPTALRAQTDSAVRTIPAQLADSTFWRLVTELSEPAGWFRSENFVSNEASWQQVIAPLRTVVPAGHAYLGVGPEQNFTYLAALEPSIGFIVDIRRQNLALHLLYKSFFELAETRADFLSLLFSRPRPSGLDTSSSAAALLDAFEAVPMDSALFASTWQRVQSHLSRTHGFEVAAEDLALMRRVDSSFAVGGPGINYSFVLEYGVGAMVARGMPSFSSLLREHDGNGVNLSFLGSEKAYRTIRSMQQRNLVVPITGDFAGSHALKAVGAWLRKHNTRVGTFYLSNVEQYLFQDNNTWPRFYGNVASLPTDSTSTFIRSVTNRWGRGGSRSGGPLMSQLIAPMERTVEAVRTGRVQWYGDVLAFVREP